MTRSRRRSATCEPVASVGCPWWAVTVVCSASSRSTTSSRSWRGSWPRSDSSSSVRRRTAGLVGRVDAGDSRRRARAPERAGTEGRRRPRGTPALLPVLPSLVVLGGFTRRGGRGRRLRTHEVTLLLVEPREHVVAHLEHRGTAFAHRVVLAVLLREEHGPHRLLLAIGDREPQIGRIQAEAPQVLRWLLGNGRAAQLAQVVHEALDGPGLRLLLAVDRPPAGLAVHQRRSRPVLAFEGDAADPVGAEA